MRRTALGACRPEFGYFDRGGPVHYHREYERAGDHQQCKVDRGPGADLLACLAGFDRVHDSRACKSPSPASTWSMRPKRNSRISRTNLASQASRLV